MKLKEIAEGDIERITPFAEVGTETSQWSKMFRHYGKLGPSWVVIEKGKILAALGMIVWYGGHGEVWMLCDQAIRKDPYRFLLFVRKVLDEYVERLKMVRIQATVISRWGAAAKFLCKLGFQKECTMVKYGMQNEDYDLYARVI